MEYIIIYICPVCRRFYAWNEYGVVEYAPEKENVPMNPNRSKEIRFDKSSVCPECKQIYLLKRG